MDKELLERAGRALYGDRWQSALARHLGISDRTMRRYVAGDVEHALLDFRTRTLPLLLIEIKKRRVQLGDLEKTIKARLGKVTP